MEAFGMYRGPSDVHVTFDLNVKVPMERDPEYPMLSAGSTTLVSDETFINLFPYHQFKPLANGMAVKLAVFFPPKAPKEIVKGHEIHLAIEFWEAFKMLGEK